MWHTGQVLRAVPTTATGNAWYGAKHNGSTHPDHLDAEPDSCVLTCLASVLPLFADSASAALNKELFCTGRLRN